MNNTYTFVAGWVLMIVLLIGLNKTAVGHVILYYLLLLMILFLVVTQYGQIAPLLNSIQGIGSFNAKG